MHIEPGIVDGAKMALAYASAAGAMGYAAREALRDIRATDPISFVLRGLAATAGTFVAFEVLPHFPVGVSEVHFILGSSLLLLLGTAPAAFGLALGLLIQSLFFAPSDLPMYFVNVTTLLVPLLGIAAMAKRVLPKGVPYVDLRYRDVLKLSAAFQGGVVAWVAFWAFYGQGVSAETFASVAAFGAAYMAVVLIEPIADLALLGVAKSLRGMRLARFAEPKLYAA